MEEKLLTVVIPAYNGEKFIKRAIDSLLNQTFKNFYINIINDGSQDATRSIVESYIQKYSNICITNLSSNKGVSYGRTLGIKNCKTPYIAFMDQDDWIDISTYENCFNALRNDEDVIIYGLNYEYIDLDITEKKYVYKKDFTISGEYALKIYGHTIKDAFRITPIVNNKIYKTNFLKSNNIIFNEKIRYQEDDIFTFEVLLFAKNVLFVSDCQYHYFQNPNSVIHTVSERSVEHFAKAYGELKNFLVRKHCFDTFKDEFYLKFKSSLKGVMRRINLYGNSPYEIRHLFAKLHEHLLGILDWEDFLKYCDLHDL